MAVGQSWRAQWQQWVHRVIDRRAPSAKQHTLGRDKLYIFPTVGGFAFCGLIAILWMLGTNYQNNLILGLCLLLTSLFVLSIIRTHSNLAGLEVRIQGVGEAFAGQMLSFEFEVRNTTRRDKDAIALGWRGEQTTAFAVDRLESKRIQVKVETQRRGWLTPPRLLACTVYPLGLLRCWTWLNYDTRGLVYPRPLSQRALNKRSVLSNEEAGEEIRGGDDFAGIRDYQRGDSLRHIAWKHYAKGKGLVTKEFSSGASAEIWLSWFELEGLATEQRLGVLCQWVLESAADNQVFGLELPGFSLEPGQGPQQRFQALQALALFREGVAG